MHDKDWERIEEYWFMIYLDEYRAQQNHGLINKKDQEKVRRHVNWWKLGITCSKKKVGKRV